MPSEDVVHHSPVQIPNPGGRPNWVLYASNQQPRRLVVFVHGFNGRAVGTWNRFANSAEVGGWWRESDMLFVGYESWKEHPGETAAWLRDRVCDFYPQLPAKWLVKRDGMLRPLGGPYNELLLVGHSLGGFVVRLAVQQQARLWLYEDRLDDPHAPRPPLLDARIRLFSPASGGFEPAGLLGMLRACCLWKTVNVGLRRAPAFTALERGSELITSTRADTEALVREHGTELAALRAHIVWARPEDVVQPLAYESDYQVQSLIPKQSHSSVCKPCDGYQEPRRFVETGKHR